MHPLSRTPAPSTWLALAATLSLTSVGAALVSQHVFGVEPCPWCVLQRLLFILVALVCCVGLVVRRPLARRVAAAAGVLLCAAGVSAGLWQHFAAAKSSSCAFTFADKVLHGLGVDSLLPAVFEPRASCADAAVNLLGQPYEFWSIALFSALGLMLTDVMLRRRR